MGIMTPTPVNPRHALLPIVSEEHRYPMIRDDMTTPLRGHAGPSRSWESIRSRWASRQIYVGIGAIAGTANIVLDISSNGIPRPVDLVFMVAALTIVTLLPLRPSWGMMAYLACWFLLLALPNPLASDMFLTHFAVFFFRGALPPTVVRRGSFPLPARR